MRLVLSQLSCVRGGRRVLHGVDAIAEPGRALLLTGPNGAGKSTLLRLVAGLLAPEGGSIRLEGGDADRTVGEQAHHLGHLDAVKSALTARETLRFWQAMFGGADAPVEPALSALSLDGMADLPAGILSAGQRRRLAIARLLVAPRPIWLLDEPTTALDAASERQFVALVEAHLQRAGLAVIATHSEIALSAADRLQLG
jgi:heme exporter protein A